LGERALIIYLGYFSATLMPTETLAVFAITILVSRELVSLTWIIHCGGIAI
jgi:hypothetical protein